MDIAARIVEVQRRIESAAVRAGRTPSDVQLVAVSKTYGLDVVRAAYDANLRHFGENRVEEAVSKISQISKQMPDITWHMIGNIQSRKTDAVAGTFQVVHSVDRFKIARRLSEAALESGRLINILIEVNITGEGSKSGYPMAHWNHDSKVFLTFCQDITLIASLNGVQLQGLMTMAPYSTDPEDARPVFSRLRGLREALKEAVPQVELLHLSMGMSGDFEVAIEEGATIVRIGTAIFGDRAR